MRVIVKNCGKVRNADIEFISGLNVIRGESGSGKSTVLRGIENLVFNSGLDDIITQGESEANITVEYNNHVITRTRTPGVSSYNLDGEEINKVGRVPVQDVLKAFGFKEIKADKSAIRPNFLSQFSYPFLVNESSSKVFEYLTITSNAVNLNGVEDAISSDIAELKQSKKSKEDTINTLKQMVLSSSEVVKHESEIKNLERLLCVFEKKQKELNNLQCLLSRITDLKNKIDLYYSKIERLENVLSSINSLNINYTRIHKKTSDIMHLESVVNNFINTKNKCDNINNSLSVYDKIKINIDETKFNSSIEKISLLKSRIEEYESCLNGFNSIKQQGVILNESNKKISSEIEEFKCSNIPIIIVSTNESLAKSLCITMEDIVRTLSNELSVAN